MRNAKTLQNAVSVFGQQQFGETWEVGVTGSPMRLYCIKINGVQITDFMLPDDLWLAFDGISMLQKHRVSVAARKGSKGRVEAAAGVMEKPLVKKVGCLKDAPSSNMKVGGAL